MFKLPTKTSERRHWRLLVILLLTLNIFHTFVQKKNSNSKKKKRNTKVIPLQKSRSICFGKCRIEQRWYKLRQDVPNAYWKRNFLNTKWCFYELAHEFEALTFSWRRSLSYRNQFIDFQSKSMDWFLYDRDLRRERVNKTLKTRKFSNIQLTLESSNSQFLELFDSSGKFFGLLNITSFFRQKNSRYLEYLCRSNKIFGPLDDFLSFFRIFVLTFRPKLESFKVRMFYSIFW